MGLNKSNSLYFQNKLRELRKEHLYRELRTVEDISESGKGDHESSVLNFSSNDYLGLSRNKFLVKKLQNLHISRISQCSSRLISGNTESIEDLEKALSKHRKTASSLLYPTGFMANLGVLGSISDKETIIFSDELNHASIIDGCKLSPSKIQRFPHNDTIELEKTVKNYDDKRKIIITEGIFSMDGDMADLREIARVSAENNCILIVDDSHGDFIIGNNRLKDFGGTPSYFGVNRRVDIHISSLSKGLGCFGGYVSCSKLVKEYLVNKSRPFIFTSALPDYLAEIAMMSMQLATRGNLQTKLYRNIEHFNKIANEQKINSRKIENSPIIPLLIGSEKKALAVSKELLKQDFFVQAIRYPTVKRNEARLRISLSSDHSQGQISELLNHISKFLRN
ncbi:aminotransferase class I/II-fold pyridoxal phosphate-dependent enzyme [Candidatus Nitrosocosmicus arcticus]|uniref:8-amino-7-oxononanoate synthase n=1 Tax=Candidatus Nitrosocosmicus arcticus TaxID=2035267 RepID=A0A557STI9_9ARCH|nr:pyridoxal phosphate-dependent aminotransferase family protein [Candidatus Nitrosocosmicus arcticus]TVP39895.1 8-amino-7-oxononanoate synthase [Candidatus Nitrosocosmicus arcticus]